MSLPEGELICLRINMLALDSLLLMLPTLLARSTFNWRGTMQPLSEVSVSDDYPGCHVIAFDRPPFGLSQRPLHWAEGRDPYSSEGGARLAAGLLDALGVRSAVIVGHSMGATVSVELLKQCAPDSTHALSFPPVALRNQAFNAQELYFTDCSSCRQQSGQQRYHLRSALLLQASGLGGGLGLGGTGAAREARPVAAIAQRGTAAAAGAHVCLLPSYTQHICTALHIATHCRPLLFCLWTAPMCFALPQAQPAVLRSACQYPLHVAEPALIIARAIAGAAAGADQQRQGGPALRAEVAPQACGGGAIGEAEGARAVPRRVRGGRQGGLPAPHEGAPHIACLPSRSPLQGWGLR